MFFLLRSFLFLFASFCIMSIPINNQSLYQFLSEKYVPMIKVMAQDYEVDTKKYFIKGFQHVKRLFFNSIPKYQESTSKIEPLKMNQNELNSLLSDKSNYLDMKDGEDEKNDSP